MKIKVLLIAANPASTSSLRLDNEIRQITSGVQNARFRDRLELISVLAARPLDLQHSLLEYSPHIVHFSGHGTDSDQLLALDTNNQPKPISTSALTGLFENLPDNIRLVFLNACFTEPQAKAISTVVDFAVGMKKEIGDEAAIVFATEFYTALAYGQTVRSAFNLGNGALKLENIPEDGTPRLLIRDGADADTLIFEPEHATVEGDEFPDTDSRTFSVKTGTFKATVNIDGDLSTYPETKKQQLLRAVAAMLDLDGPPDHDFFAGSILLELRNLTPEQAERLEWAIERGDFDEFGVRGVTVEEIDELLGEEVLPKEPEQIGRYHIMRTLSEGGFGSVYLAMHEHTARRVAIKVPQPGQILRSEDVERFFAEARLLVSLHHPGIVPAYDVGRTDDGLCYMVSQFVEGTDLQTILERSRLSHHDAAYIMAAVAGALHYAHSQGLIHRNVKPSNILIDRTGHPCVTGFALPIEEDRGGGSGLVGTPAYMSPEQARDEGHLVDGRSDIFSLGVVFYELLTGRRPFTAADRGQLLEQIKSSTEAVPLRQHEAGIPQELERICLKALSKKMSDRYTAGAEMAGELRNFLSKVPGSVTNSIGMQLKLIQAGEFMMGTPDDIDGFSNEHPPHRVRITKPFYIGIYPVTQQEYEQVIGDNPSLFSSSNQQPVETVSWFDAVTFCNRLSDKEGLEHYYKINDTIVSINGGPGYRLPTEAEWEYACRAGTTTKWSCGDNVGDLEATAWHRESPSGTTHPVGEKEPNPWGLYDMHGNVWEWCWDWYGVYGYANAADPTGPSSGHVRVLRGGSFVDVSDSCRSAFRLDRPPVGRTPIVGFRVSRTYN